jgi:hypothetical protein
MDVIFCRYQFKAYEGSCKVYILKKANITSLKVLCFSKIYYHLKEHDLTLSSAFVTPIPGVVSCLVCTN